MIDPARKDIQEQQSVTSVEEIHNKTAQKVAQSYEAATGESRPVEEFIPPSIEGQSLDLERLGIMPIEPKNPSYAETIAGPQEDNLSGIMEDVVHNLPIPQSNVRIVPGNKPNLWTDQRKKRLKFAK